MTKAILKHVFVTMALALPLAGCMQSAPINSTQAQYLRNCGLASQGRIQSPSPMIRDTAAYSTDGLRRTAEALPPYEIGGCSRVVAGSPIGISGGVGIIGS